MEPNPYFIYYSKTGGSYGAESFLFLIFFTISINKVRAKWYFYPVSEGAPCV